jgi:hypothetical protein
VKGISLECHFEPCLELLVVISRNVDLCECVCVSVWVGVRDWVSEWVVECRGCWVYMWV